MSYTSTTAKIMNIKINNEVKTFVKEYFQNIPIIFKLIFYIHIFFLFDYLFFFVFFTNSEKIIKFFPIIGDVFRFFKTLILA